MVGLVGRRFVLAAVASLVVVAQIVFVTPELFAAEPVPTWTAHAPSLRVFDANVYVHNPSMQGYAAEITAYHPQVLTMQEAAPNLVEALTYSGALASLPYRYQVKRSDPWSFFLASRYPLLRTSVVSIDRRPLLVQTTVQLPSGPQPLWVVHTIAPLPVSFSQWQADFDRLGALLKRRGAAGLLVVGDFNATWGNRGFRALLDDGLLDGAAARGEALSMTYSEDSGPVPPLARVDHVLTGSGVAVTSVSTEDGPGSDHRAVLATVAFRHG